MKYEVYPLYAALPNQEQLKVFQRLPTGTRKIILATNIAETSITISNIRYVVDTGFYKTKSYIPKSGIDVLEVKNISKNNAVQVIIVILTFS